MNSKVLQRRLKRYLRECFAVAVIFTTALYVIDRPSLNRNLIQNVQQRIYSIVSAFSKRSISGIRVLSQYVTTTKKLKVLLCIKIDYIFNIQIKPMPWISAFLESLIIREIIYYVIIFKYFSSGI